MSRYTYRARYPARCLRASKGRSDLAVGALRELRCPMEGNPLVAGAAVAIPALARWLIKRAVPAVGRWVVTHPGWSLFGGIKLAKALRKKEVEDRPAPTLASLIGPVAAAGTGGVVGYALGKKSADALGQPMPEEGELNQVSVPEADARQLSSSTAYRLIGEGVPGLDAVPLGDVFKVNPQMIAIFSALGDKLQKRDEVQPLVSFLAGDPVLALSRPCPLYAMSGCGEFAPQAIYAENLMAGGILDSIKKVVKKVAPTVASVAGKLANVASFVPGIGTAVSTGLKAVSGVASKVASAGGELVNKAGSKISQLIGGQQTTNDGFSGSTDANGAVSVTGHATTIVDNRARELRDMAGEALPPAIYGDPLEASSHDKKAVREVMAALTVPGVVLADQYQVPSATYALAGGDTDEVAQMEAVAGKGVVTGPVSTSSASQHMSDEKLAGYAAAYTQKAQVLKEKTEAIKAKVGSATAEDAFTKSPGGDVSLSPEAESTLTEITGDTPNADPLFKRGFALFKELDAKSLTGALKPVSNLRVPESFVKEIPGLNFYDRKYDIPASKINQIVRGMCAVWQDKPKTGVTPILDAAMGAPAITTLIRESDTDAQKEAMLSLALLAASVVATSEEMGELESIADLQRNGFASPDQARRLSDAVGLGLLEASAIVDDAASRSRDRKSVAVSPALRLLLARTADVLSGAVEDKELKSNAGLLEKSLAEYHQMESARLKLAIPAEELNDKAAARVEIEGSPAIDPSDEALWRENKGWLSNLEWLEDAKLNTILTALGFSAALIPLLISAFKARRAAKEADPERQGVVGLRSRDWVTVGPRRDRVSGEVTL